MVIGDEINEQQSESGYTDSDACRAFWTMSIRIIMKHLKTINGGILNGKDQNTKRSIQLNKIRG